MAFSSLHWDVPRRVALQRHSGFNQNFLWNLEVKKGSIQPFVQKNLKYLLLCQALCGDAGVTKTYQMNPAP